MARFACDSPNLLYNSSHLKGRKIKGLHTRQNFRPKASVQSVTGPIARFNSRKMSNLDRRISVAPMMDGVNSWRFTFVTQLLSNPAK
jgi:hypothetical protein